MMIVVLRKYVLPSALLIILFIRIIHISRQRNDQARRLTLSSRWPQLVPYVCGCFVRAMPAQRLVPGDVIVVQPGIAVCDAVLLRGACLCEQSTLSGEVRTRTASLVIYV